MIRSTLARVNAGLRNVGIAVATSLPVLALAQTTDPFTGAMEEATGKVTSYAGALVGLAAVSVIFMIAIKYVKKIKGAA